MARLPLHAALTRRERQIMDVLYRRGRATATEVMADLAGNPHYSTVRTQLRVLERKGYVRHDEAGLRYVYEPVVPRQAARRGNVPGSSLCRGPCDMFQTAGRALLYQAVFDRKSVQKTAFFGYVTPFLPIRDANVNPIGLYVISRREKTEIGASRRLAGRCHIQPWEPPKISRVATSGDPQLRCRTRRGGCRASWLSRVCPPCSR